MTEKNFYFLQGTLRVAAKGYWFTGGGAKGSFGFYPHLKDRNGLPVYPDTQLHGDLRMASRWAVRLGFVCSNGLFERLFGKQGDESAALMHIGDLCISDQAKWDKDNKRFQIKNRIEIDDSTRCVIDKMLMSFEAAWLDGLELEAKLFVGYFENENEAEAAAKLLRQAGQLLSGFGALRSRGYGGGDISMDIPVRKVTVSDNASAVDGSSNYHLTSIVNIRSKPVAAEKLQLVSTNSTITVSQIRGWFVRTFKQVTGNWPDADKMSSITFSPLYQSGGKKERAFPPPKTTLRKEDGSSIDDYWGKEQEEHDNDNENFVKCKLKPLKHGFCVTESGSVVPSTLAVRMRNAMEDDFLTKEEGGLFVQQYLPAETVFSGTVTIAEPASDFGRLAGAILTTLNPVINGTPFVAEIVPIKKADAAPQGVCLVFAPVAFDLSRRNADKESIEVGTVRSYNSSLGRPRRNRTAILPGSVVTDNLPGSTAWCGFGRTLDKPKKSTQSPYTRTPVQDPLKDHNIDWHNKDLTRSQAGVLRELTNPDLKADFLLTHLVNLHEKHLEKQSGSVLAKLFGALRQEAEGTGGVPAMQKLVQRIHDYLRSEIWWPEKQRKSSDVHQEDQR